jgi:CheY-like chemotaxis protein
MFEPILSLLADTPEPPFFDGHEPSSPSEARTRLRVLVVDDERLIADTVAAILNGSGFEALEVYNGADAIKAARHFRPDIILSDVLMPRMTGVELGMQVRREFPEMRIFLFSGQAATTELVTKARADGHHFDLLAKPIHPEELIARLKSS